jgi:serine/threonine-protein kinase
MLDDKYRIERLLAAGSMGVVYLGTHTRLRKRVAIKVLNPELSSASMIERFHREAITASQIGHEGIAQVTDLGTSREGEPFLVMEYLEGESLASRLRVLGPLAVEDACELGYAILSPLGAAHRAGIIHRDLKPDNVFLVRQSRGETVKLLDFGISRAPGLSSEHRLTMTGHVLGTPYYMSPEQARGEGQITPAADLYAFGVMLYEMLAGDVPIRAENYNQLMYRVMIGDFARPRERRPDLPEDLERIILHAMAQASEDRPASVAEIEQALLPFCRPMFREHASGGISTPGLALRTPPFGNRASDTTIDLDRFAGETIANELDPRLPRLPRLGDTDPEPTDTAVAQRTERTERVLASTLSVSPLADDEERFFTDEAMPRSPARWILTGIAGAITGGVLVVLLARGDDARVAVAPAPSAGTIEGSGQSPVAPVGQAAQPATENVASAEAPDGNPAVAQPTTITLSLAITPPGAVITLDGARVRGTELVVPKDAAPHRLRITAAGHLGHDEAISFDQSQRLVVQLKQVAVPRRGEDPRKDRSGTERIERVERTERIESTSPYE